MAAPTYGTAGTYYENFGTTAPAFAAPASVVADSIVVIVTYLDGVADPGITLPGGFAHAEGSPVYIPTSSSPSQNHRLVVAWHRASGSESGPYTFTLGTSVYVSGQAHRYDGCVTTGTPIDSPTASDGSVTNSTTSPPIAVTTQGADRLVLHAATSWAGGTWTAPTGFALRQQGGFGSSTVADKSQAAAGGTGSVSATVSGSDKMQAWLGALIGTTGGGGATAIPGRPQLYAPRRRAANW